MLHRVQCAGGRGNVIPSALSATQSIPLHMVFMTCTSCGWHVAGKGNMEQKTQGSVHGSQLCASLPGGRRNRSLYFSFAVGKWDSWL